ncbi:hypothetical protein GCM10022402_50000 [Salinactinospora qingdaonensis]|uniref:Uncharacterized protein n=1 Tax=Salinactinospora qingdaonensis TaxID=702744 RepID=A0ABP7GLC0_9ACTN
MAGQLLHVWLGVVESDCDRLGWAALRRASVAGLGVVGRVESGRKKRRTFLIVAGDWVVPGLAGWCLVGGDGGGALLGV